MSADSADHVSEPAVRAPVKAAWIAAPETCQNLARVLQPLAVGLMDEMVDAVLFSPDAAAAQEALAGPFPIVPYAWRRWWALASGEIESIAAELRRRKTELVHALDGSAAQVAGRLAQAAELKWVISSYCLSDAEELGRAAVGADAVLAASEPILDRFAASGAGPPERVHLLRPGVYHVRHPACFAEPGRHVAILAGLGSPGREAPAAGAPMEAVLRCFAELSAGRRDCVFYLLAGGGRQRAQASEERWVRRRAVQIGLRRDLTFVDCLPAARLAEVFQAADVYISPCPQAGLDMRPLLAMASGVPVLAGGGAGANDFLRDGTTAIFFRPGDAGELTVKLGSLLDDRAAARALAESALGYIREHHSAAGGVAALCRLYRQVLGSSAAGPS